MNRSTVHILAFVGFLAASLPCAWADTGTHFVWTVTKGTQSIQVPGIVGAHGHLLVALRPTVIFLGFADEICGPCGNDEVYPRNDPHSRRGHLLIKWFQKFVLYAGEKGAIFLDAETLRKDRVTWVSPEVLKVLGLKSQVSRTDRSIVITE